MNKQKSSLKKILILVGILAVPGFLYYLLTEKGKNRYKPLEIFGAKQVSSTFHTKRGKQIPDTLYHTIRNFSLTNQVGKPVQFPADTAMITVVNFFFSTCPDFCLTMNKEMQRVEQKFAKNKFIRFISITVDPEKDNTERLLKYSKTLGAKPGKWDFVTGDKSLIYELARKDFLVDALPDPANPGNFIHTPMLILVDPHKRIRGFYDSGSRERVDILVDEIKVLIAEELRNVKNR
ncbi:MAG TPA: SCO family protein [Sphingobacteriaceae bacterium]|nr:SCO family protein [Sphingobacteriaceae bacterium]